jgi:hypothetical protein
MRCSFVIGLFLIGNGGRDAGASVTELSAVYDGFYHRPNFVISCSEPGLDVCEEEVIGWLQCPSEGVRCHFAGKSVQEVLLALGLDVLLQTCDARLFDTTGEWCSGINRFATLVKFPQLTDGAESFEDKPIGVEACVASGAGWVIPVL